MFGVNPELFDRLHYPFNMLERDEVTRLGEAVYNRLKLRQMLQWAAAHPENEV